LRNFKFCILILHSAFCILSFYGCATVATREALSTYNLNGTAYLPLASLCGQRQINFDYDTFTRTATLSRDAHKINLRVGDDAVLVDGKAMHLKHPVDIYQGIVVVPYKFKEQVLDALFKKAYPPGKAIFAAYKIKKIVIDAGHGGDDPGAIGKTGLREKDVTLDIAKELSSLLKSQGVEVVMTRSTDRFVPLASRVVIANNSHADLFLSIHANANRASFLNGFEVYYVSPSVDDSARALSSAQNAEPDFESSCFASHSLNLKAILWDLIYTNSRAESIELARAICRTISRNLDTRVLGIKGARFQVLKGARMPAILVEIGFLSNYKEEGMLKNANYRQKVAEAIVQGIEGYARESTSMEMVKQ
jgi:N-acetylmuramoyl-L-alanine amidase